jgi:uncharacterized membrane protein YdjX (TVP38/TMEM64 family)
MPVRSLAVALARRHGSRIDDLILRAFAVVALLGILGSLLDPTVAALAPFVLFTLWANGPHSALMVAGYEPVLLLYGQLFPPLLLAALGTIATLFMEWANYHLYGYARDMRAVRTLTGGRCVQYLTRMFARHPFPAVALCALGVVPFTAARCLSVLSRYPIGRHLAATAVGRFPRLLAIAALGTSLALPHSFLLIGVLLSLAAATSVWLVARRRLMAASLISQSA